MIWLISTGFVFTCTVIFHGAMGKLKIIKNSVARYLLIWCVGAFALITWMWIKEARGPGFFASIALFAFLGELYVFLFTFVISSVSVEILLSQKTQKSFHSKPPKEIVEKRIATLMQIKWIKPSGNLFQVTMTGHKILNMHQYLRWFFQHKNY